MTTIIGLDLSLAATGLATWINGSLTATTITTAAKDYPCLPARYAHILGHIWARATGGDPVLVVKEAPIIGQRQGSIDIIGLHALVDYGLWARGVGCVSISPGTLKVFATGKGASSKQAVMLAAERRLGLLCPIEDDDQADALWLVVMTLAHYGRFLVTVPAAHMRALKVPKWPEFDLAAEVAA